HMLPIKDLARLNIAAENAARLERYETEKLEELENYILKAISKIESASGKESDTLCRLYLSDQISKATEHSPIGRVLLATCIDEKAIFCALERSKWRNLLDSADA